MAILSMTAHGSFEKASDESRPEIYASNSLRLLIEGMGRKSDAQVLDVGPVCGENITFFAQHVKRLYVCDLFIRLDRDRREGLPAGHALRHLDYPPETFDGIILWELADRLDDPDLRTLAELCRTMTRPRGRVMVIASHEQVMNPTVNAFVAGDGFRLRPRPQLHLDLPLRGRQNRDLLDKLAPFTPFKSYIYRNGLREFLLERP